MSLGEEALCSGEVFSGPSASHEGTRLRFRHGLPLKLNEFFSTLVHAVCIF